MTERLHGKPKKLRDDSWGAFIYGRPAPGECITMTSQSGKSWDAYVGKIVWQGEDGAIVTLEPRGDDAVRRSARGVRASWQDKRESDNSEAPPIDWGDGRDYRTS